MLRSLAAALLAFAPLAFGYVVNNGTTCYLYPESLTHFGQPVDDSPSIQQAFELCGYNGTVVFTKHTFHVGQVLNTTNLKNCDVELHGEIEFSTNVPYWLSHSINVGLQNQSTAWLIGGENLNFVGKGGWINGNGQTWYTQNRNNSNEPGRPITMTWFNSTNLYVDSLNITQPQFWANFITYSRNVTMNNVYVNATSHDKWGTVNTDGADTWNSKDVFLTNWTVTNGDDCIAAKGNTTNLIVRNATCHGGAGMTIGSVGQYPLTPDYDENIVFEDVDIVNGEQAAYIKTWQGLDIATSQNGDAGGGGSGLIRNITFRNFNLINVALPMMITQCIYTEGTGADTCETSKMQIEDVTFRDFTGTSRYNIVASFHCAASHPCPGIYLQDANITSVNQTLGLPLFNTTLQKEVYQCANIVNENSTSGIPCNHWAPDNYGQWPNQNVQ